MRTGIRFGAFAVFLMLVVASSAILIWSGEIQTPGPEISATPLEVQKNEKPPARLAPSSRNEEMPPVPQSPEAFQALPVNLPPENTTEGRGRIEGRVVDTQGKPLSGMYVTTGRPVSGGFPRADTDAEGRFVADKLLPGTYTLMALPVATTGSRLDSGIQEFALKEGQVLTGVRLVYEGISDRTISGRVTNATGGPVEGAKIVGDAGGRGAYANTSTNGEGFYVLDLLPHAHCLVSVEHVDYSVHAKKWFQAGDQDVDFVLLRRGVITGRVLDASTALPLAGIDVGAKLHHQRFSPINYEGRTDRDGKFRLDHVSAGEVDVYANAAGYAPGRTKSIQVNPDSLTQGVTVRLNRGASVHGVIRTMDGAPVSGAQLRLGGHQDWALLPAVTSPGSDIIAVQSGEDGRFEIDLLDPGFTELTAVHPDFPETSVAMALDVGKTTVVNIVMTGLAAIEGSVFANGEGATRGNVEVDTDSSESSKSTAIEEDGFFRVDGVPGGPIVIRASVLVDGSYRDVSAEAVAVPGYTTTVYLEAFSGAGAIEGGVTRNGDPLPGVSVSVNAVEGDDSAGSITTSDGFYRVTGLFGGVYRVAAVEVLSGEPVVLARENATVVAGETTELDIAVNELAE